MPDGHLWLVRDTYAAETAWAPRHVGRELRLSRLGTFDAALGALRADAEAAAARKGGDHDRAERHETLAGSYRALRDHYQHQEQALAQTMVNRQEWEQATARSRQLAIAADTELRRRHPGQKVEPLRSSEPASPSNVERKQLHPVLDNKLTETIGWIREPTARCAGFDTKLEKRRAVMVPGENLGRGDPDEVSPFLSPFGREAILQPPKPQMTPSARILDLAAGRDTEPEAAD